MHDVVLSPILLNVMRLIETSKTSYYIGRLLPEQTATNAVYIISLACCWHCLTIGLHVHIHTLVPCWSVMASVSFRVFGVIAVVCLTGNVRIILE